MKDNYREVANILLTRGAVADKKTLFLAGCKRPCISGLMHAGEHDSHSMLQCRFYSKDAFYSRCVCLIHFFLMHNTYLIEVVNVGVSELHSGIKTCRSVQ